MSRVFVGTPNQKGHGIGSTLKGLFRWARPLLIRGAKYLAPKALNTGQKILSDVLEGENVKTAAKRRFVETFGTSGQEGSGLINKRRKVKRRSVARNKSVRAQRDIFSS